MYIVRSSDSYRPQPEYRRRAIADVEKATMTIMVSTVDSDLFTVMQDPLLSGRTCPAGSDGSLNGARPYFQCLGAARPSRASI
jgi:hypothetical protein